MLAFHNGEIYNYLELRDELRALGHAFRTPPTPRCCSRPTPNGVVRCSSASTACSRSRSGTGERVALLRARPVRRQAALLHRGRGPASLRVEIKALSSHPGAPAGRTTRACSTSWRTGSSTTREETFFAGVRQVPPGGYLQVRSYATAPAAVRWYTLRPAGGDGRPMLEPGFAPCSTGRCRCACGATSPSASVLSGGMDSSAVLSRRELLASARPRRLEAPQSFSARSSDPATDETPTAERVVSATGSKNAQVLPAFAGLVEELDSIV